MVNRVVVNLVRINLKLVYKISKGIVVLVYIWGLNWKINSVKNSGYLLAIVLIRYLKFALSSGISPLAFLSTWPSLKFIRSGLIKLKIFLANGVLK